MRVARVHHADRDFPITHALVRESSVVRGWWRHTSTSRRACLKKRAVFARSCSLARAGACAQGSRTSTYAWNEKKHERRVCGAHRRRHICRWRLHASARRCSLSRVVLAARTRALAIEDEPRPRGSGYGAFVRPVDTDRKKLACFFG